MKRFLSLNSKYLINSKYSISIFVILLFFICGVIFGIRNVISTNNSIKPQSSYTPNKYIEPHKVEPNIIDSNKINSNDILTNEKESKKNTKFEDIKVKGLYLTGWTVGNMSNVQHYVDLANKTEINSYVVDIKDDDGYVGYKSNIPETIKYNTWQEKYNVDAVLKTFHDSNIYVIGRIVCFKDPVYSTKNPELAIKNNGTGLWRDNHGLTWLNPYNKNSWPYLIDIAKEGLQKGFDEIQFDYIRFANDGPKKAMNLGQNSQKKYEAIDEFLAFAKKELPSSKVSADVFGIICESPNDAEDIGQNLEYVGKDIDFLSPMVYPSHYAVGQIVYGVKFNKPDLEPYRIVYNSLIKAKNRVFNLKDYNAKFRPYIQDFTASWLGRGYYQNYGPTQLRQQIKAIYDVGIDEWLVWNAGNKYSESAFEKKP